MNDSVCKQVLDRYEHRYAEIWQDIEQGLTCNQDCFFLMGAANYIFQTGDVRWAVDPMFRTPRSGVALEQINPDQIFHSFCFVLLTHEHRDHFDPRLMERYPDIGWVVPDHLTDMVPRACHKYMTVIRPGEVVDMCGARIEAFASPHFDAGTTHLGVKELGYLVDTGKYRILLPGDIRDYHASMPGFTGITHLFSHVWLGRGNALNLPCGSFPQDLARFMMAFRPGKVYLTHLMEAARPLTDLWTYTHAGLVMDAMMALDPAADISIPMVGKPNWL